MKVNGVAADGPLAHHMPAIAGKVMEVPGNGGCWRRTEKKMSFFHVDFLVSHCLFTSSFQ